VATNIYEPVEAYKPKTGNATDHPAQGSLADVFSEETLDHYIHATDRDKEEPHIWNLAGQCFRNLGKPDAVNPSITDQAIVITGESGAGKTFTTKQVLKFLAKVGSPGGTPTHLSRRSLVLCVYFSSCMFYGSSYPSYY